MARQVIWTESAWDDLERIADSIAVDSPYYAAAFVQRVRDKARNLVIIPEAGAIVPELDDTQIREVFEKSYRLIYHVGDEAVSVLGLIHGARDLTALWNRDERQP
ncbi:MAG: type II toxin-antitoxin system RelE/ParE family toxin [Candidatus Saccharimonas sp.]|nr:type II toxin-antitoxin system RelE/ParE family toxin [Planctomycetaceae bacterium]